MAGAGAKKFPAFSKLSSDDVNNYLADQVIMRFATTTARDAAFGGVGEPTLAEGMTAYIDADNSIYTYDGSNWVKMVSAINPPALTLISQGTFTGVTAASPLVLANVLTTEYPHYKIIMSWTQSTAAGFLNMRLRNAGGLISTPTYDFQVLETNLGSVIATGGLNGNQWGSLAYNYNLGFQSFFNADLTFATINQPTQLNGVGMTKRTGGGGSFIYNQSFTNMETTVTIATGINLYPDGGAMAGSYSLYGYR